MRNEKQNRGGQQTHLDGVDPDKVDLALVLARDGLERLDNLGALRVGTRDKDVRERDPGLGVGGKVVGRDLVEQRDRVLLGKLVQRLGRDGAFEVVAALVKGLVHDDGGGLDVGGGDGGGVGRETKEVVVAVLVGKLLEGVGSLAVRGVDVGDQDDFVGALELVVVLGRDVRNGRQRLLLHVRDDAIRFPRARVVGRDTVAEHLQCPVGG